jgi:molecular chaperone DnaK
MSDKLYCMLKAMENGDTSESEILLREVQPDVQHWLNQDLPSNSIVTGITK